MPTTSMTRTLLAAALFTCLPALAGAQAPDPRVENLLRQMTLEEKVGEMTQIDISIVTRVNGTATTPQQIDSAKLEQLLVKRNVGSLLNVSYVALTPAQWVDLTSMVQRFAARRRLPSSMESMRCTATSTCVAPRSFRRTSTWPRHGIATSCGGRIRSPPTRRARAVLHGTSRRCSTSRDSRSGRA